jgi:putative peptidoglycan lipid II flippase
MSEAAMGRSRGTSGRTLLRSAGVVASIRALDFGLSFLVSVLLANRFGASGQLDAFFLARRTTVGFADTIRKLVGQIVLPPVLAAVDRGETPSIRHLPRRMGWFFVCFSLVMVGGMLVPTLWARLFAPGFHGEQLTLTAGMMRIMLPLLPIAVIASLLAAILQARRRYMLSEGTNLVQRAILVAVLALLVPPLGIVAGAWTMLVAGVVGFLILLAGAWSTVRSVPRDHAATRAEPAPPVAGGGLAAAIVINVYFQAMALLDFAFATTSGDGGVASLEYGSRLVSLVPGLVMSSLATVLTPELIRAVQQPDRIAAAAGIQRFQRIGVFAQAPVSMGMMLGAPLMVSALFGHGAFGPQAIASAAACTAGYAAAAVFLAPMSAITTSIYADPHAPALRDLTLIAILGTIIRVAALAFAAPRWGAPGIAYAAAVATALTFGVAQVVAVRRFHHFHMRAQLADLAQTAACAGFAAAAGWLLLWLIPDPQKLFGELALLAALGALVVVVYFGAAMVLRVPEMAALRDIVGQIVARRRKRRG